MKIKDAWEKYKLWIELATSVLGGMVTTLTFPADKVWIMVVAGIVGFIITFVLVNICYFNIVVYPNLKEIRDYQYLLEGVRGVLKETESIGRKKRAVAIDFVVSSLEYITKRGFLEVDLPFHEFLSYIERLAEDTKGDIFGTAPVRPKDLARDKQACQYLKIILNSPAKKATRVGIFRDCELKAIVQEALDSLQAGTQVPTPLMNDIPEIAWWVTEANNLSYKAPMYPVISHATKTGVCLL